MNIIFLLVFLAIIIFLLYEIIMYIKDSNDLIKLSNEIKLEQAKEKTAKKNEELEQQNKLIHEITTEGFRVAGTSKYKNNIIDLVECNSKSSEYVYQYKEEEVDLVKEPDNIYDSNAIAVYMDDVKIGYVPSKITKYIAVLLDDTNFIGELSGGDIRKDGEVIQRNFSCTVRINYED